MGIRVSIGGEEFQASEYSSYEESSPILSSDSSGGVGSFQVVIPSPDPILGVGPVATFGKDWLIDQTILISDTRLGSTIGVVTAAEYAESGVTIVLSGPSRMGSLNVYNIQAQPYSGTLGGALAYYFSLAGITTGISIDPTITSRSVTLPGFSGELWFYLKRLVATQGCDISLVSGVITVRPLRARVAEQDNYTSRTGGTSGGSLAQSVEVYWYPNSVITNQLVYPPGGWKSDTEVLNVNAGETATYQLELSASVSSIQAPVMGTSVAKNYSSSSVYTIVADDGFPVASALWAANGGSVVVSINVDTASLTVDLVGATNIPTILGTYSKSFSLALAADSSGSRYSTLRIVGTGVAYTRTRQEFLTGVSASSTPTLIGETHDNVFITDLNTLYNTGTAIAKRYTGVTPKLSGTIFSINKRSSTGSATYRTYAETKAAVVAALGGTPTYGNVKTYYVTTLSLPTYGAITDYWFLGVMNDFDNQVFGNANGARVYDVQTNRWYRIRTATSSPTGVDFTADEDLVYGDRRTGLGVYTYGQIATSRVGLTYRQDKLIGLYYG